MASPSPTSGPVASAPSRARELLRDVFGFAEYRPDQEEIVDHLVAGGDAFVLMPTGGGKSLCYQLPRRSSR
jgi:ATP-dependent DNA helicase RecQ